MTRQNSSSDELAGLGLQPQVQAGIPARPAPGIVQCVYQAGCVLGGHQAQQLLPPGIVAGVAATIVTGTRTV